MERGFGADFSRVRVHADAESDKLNHSLQARVFTLGQDLFFRRSDYRPKSREGQGYQVDLCRVLTDSQHNPDMEGKAIVRLFAKGVFDFASLTLNDRTTMGAALVQLAQTFGGGEAQQGDQEYGTGKGDLGEDLGVSGRDKALAAYTTKYVGQETKAHAHHGSNYTGGARRFEVLSNMLDAVHASKGPTVLAAIQKDFPSFKYNGSYRG